MVWVTLDDRIDEHPKIARLDDHAFALFVRGLAYCNRNLTDGFIPTAYAQAQMRPCETRLKLPAQPIRRLVEVGLWETTEGGWLVHDFAEYQPKREKVLADRQRNAERQANYRRTAPRSNAATDDVSNDVSNATPDSGTTTRESTNVLSNPPVSPRKTTVDEEFVDKMVEEFGVPLGGSESVRDRIALAQSWTPGRKYTDQQRYVRNWLRRDAERTRPSLNGSGPRHSSAAKHV